MISAEAISDAFVGLNIGGAVIGGISLIVGLFGVANIMFVTVRERTGQIGIKKALGAKKRVILSEFLLESAFLCIIGGLIGLILVFLLTLILSAVRWIFPFLSLQQIWCGPFSFALQLALLQALFLLIKRPR